jgi:hypothetical protein
MAQMQSPSSHQPAPIAPSDAWDGRITFIHDLSRDQATKTRRALEFLSARIAEA